MTKAELKNIRSKFGKSQWEMGQLLQVSQEQISVWERGRRPIPDKIADKILRMDK